MSRLEFAPKPKEMEVTDIATGRFVFPPAAGKRVSYPDLNEAIENAGYAIERAAITVSGTLTAGRALMTPDGQLFALQGGDEAARRALAELRPGTEATVRGAWKILEGEDVVIVSELERR